MAALFTNPFPQFLSSTPETLVGYRLFFYATGSSTKQNTYSDAALISANSNPITLNADGCSDTAIYLQNLDYKVVLAAPVDTPGADDPPASAVKTRDPVRGSDFASFSVLKVCSGNPNGQLAGTAASAGVLPTAAWDFLNQILYFCTATGTALTAAWTAINASAVTPANPQPQGYLTLTSGTPIIAGDVAAATAVYYTPYTGKLVPIYNDSQFIPTGFSELTLTLVASHLASTIYDVFVFSDSGTLRLVTGPAWATSTAAAGVRGTGAGTTQLTRLNGFWVNTVSMTGRNGATTYSVGANLATYVGSIFMDASNGQITNHRTYGQSRKWGVWNAYNRQPIILQMGDTTASWAGANGSATVRQSNAAAGNTLAVFAGLAEEFFEIIATQNFDSNSNSGSLTIGVGVNSTTAMSGVTAAGATGSSGGVDNFGLTARHIVGPALGVQNINFLEACPSTVSVSALGGNDDMLMTVRWLG